MEFSHLDKEGKANMVNVGDKEITVRNAKASACVYMREETLKQIKNNGLKKGDALCVAKTAGIMAAKNTPFIIPLCHNIFLNSIDIHFEYLENGVKIFAEVTCEGKTGAEMEALHAVSVSALTLYDMAKALDKEMVITDIMLLEKSGGKSGHFIRDAEE